MLRAAVRRVRVPCLSQCCQHHQWARQQALPAISVCAGSEHTRKHRYALCAAAAGVVALACSGTSVKCDDSTEEEVVNWSSTHKVTTSKFLRPESTAEVTHCPKVLYEC
jgi:hypothetical protein